MKRARQDSLENEGMTTSSSEARELRRSKRNPNPLMDDDDNNIYCIFPIGGAKNTVTIYKGDIKRLQPGSS